MGLNLSELPAKRRKGYSRGLAKSNEEEAKFEGRSANDEVRVTEVRRSNAKHTCKAIRDGLPLLSFDLRTSFSLEFQMPF